MCEYVTDKQRYFRIYNISMSVNGIWYGIFLFLVLHLFCFFIKQKNVASGLLREITVAFMCSATSQLSSQGILLAITGDLQTRIYRENSY